MRRCLLTLATAATLMGAAVPVGAQTLADYDYEHLVFRGLGVDGGYLWSDKVEPTEHWGARLDLGYLGPGVRIIPSLGYWSSQLTEDELEGLATQLNAASGSELDGSDLGPVEWSDLSLSLDAQVVWNTPLRVLTFAGLGVGFHALNGQGAAIDDTFVEDLLDTITTGASLLGGLELEVLSGVRAYAEGRYTAMNSIQYLTARGGIQVMFGGGRPVVPAAGAVRGSEGGR